MVLAYDAHRDVVVMYGGVAADGTVLEDTWEYSFGVSPGWTQLTPAVSPGPWSGGGSAFDSTRNRVVITNGIGALGSVIFQTWAYDGIAWAEITNESGTGNLLTFDASSGLAGDDSMSMTYDAARDRLVAVGGCHYSTDPWEYDPVHGWVNVVGGFSRGRSDNSSLTIDPVNHTAYLADGFPGSHATWRWDPITPIWVEVDTDGGASAWASAGNSDMASLTWDSHNARPMWFVTDSADSTVPSTRLFDLVAGVWNTAAPVHTPPVRLGYGVVWRSTNNTNLLFGGFDFNTSAYFNDLWTWDGTDWALVSGGNNLVTPTPSPPNPPQNVVATVTGELEVTITWDAPVDNGSPITGYNTTDGSTEHSLVVVLSEVRTGLFAGTEYTFGAQAVAAGGTSDFAFAAPILITRSYLRSAVGALSRSPCGDATLVALPVEQRLLSPLPTPALEALRGAVTSQMASGAPLVNVRAALKLVFSTELGSAIKDVLRVPADALDVTLCTRQKLPAVDQAFQAYYSLANRALQELRVAGVPDAHLSILAAHTTSASFRNRVAGLCATVLLAAVIS